MLDGPLGQTWFGAQGLCGYESVNMNKTTLVL